VWAGPWWQGCSEVTGLDSRKLERARELIQRGAASCPRSMVCWSGGKDSMVLLHLLRSEGFDWPLVWFREPWQPAKYAFHEQLLRDWQLLAYSWHPRASALQGTGSDLEVQNWYQFNGMTLTCPTGIVPPDPDLPWTCGLELLQRPKQLELELPPLDGLWIGHKRCDGDPVLGGDAGTRIEARPLPQGVTMFFPLRDWSHDDIWAYIEAFEVPYDTARYEQVHGVWRERPAQRANADYVHACTRCMERRPGAPKVVSCPKLRMDIENIAEQLPWVEAEKLSYMQD
jgi:hypothetical protein